MEKVLRERFKGNLSEFARNVEAKNGEPFSVSTLHGIQTSGSTDPDTLVRLGKAAGYSAPAMFVIAGWWPDEPGSLPEDQAQFLRTYQELDGAPRLQLILLRETQLIARGLRELRDEAVLESGWTP